MSIVSDDDDPRNRWVAIQEAGVPEERWLRIGSATATEWFHELARLRAENAQLRLHDDQKEATLLAARRLRRLLHELDVTKELVKEAHSGLDGALSVLDKAKEP